jgi:hypothetical protein
MDPHGYFVPGRRWVWEKFCTRSWVRVWGWGWVYVHGYGSGESIPDGEFSIDISILVDVAGDPEQREAALVGADGDLERVL